MPPAPLGEFTDVVEITNGYWPNTNIFEQIPAVIVSGQNVWVLGPKNLISDYGATNIGGAGGAISPAMVSNGVIAGMTGGGAVVSHDGIPWFQGPGGNGYLAGMLLG